MKIYLVGGAVRDALLSRPVHEKDFVVVGSTVDEMLAQKFQPVGKAFPVFLHPQTKEEYALARTEKKVGKGYHGFTFHAAPDVTLEEDLIRRDLTINAMAQDEDGMIIDPYNGRKDLDQKILRHVSLAFAEDPVRILRLARFAARFSYLGFKVAPETIELMKQMVQEGEVDALVPERVWKELQSALREPNPEAFFEVLDSCDALNKLFPELKDFTALKVAVKLTEDPIIRFAALMPSDSLCKHYRIPNDYRELAKLVSTLHGLCQDAVILSADELMVILEGLDAFRRPERLMPFLIACQAVNSDQNDKHSARILAAYEAAAAVNTRALANGLIGLAIREAIHLARVEAIDAQNGNQTASR
jgi:tRNA nucleotidyltransferase (CCA-adding enzyme)